MKRALLLVIAVFAFAASSFTQEAKAPKPSEYNIQKSSLFEFLPITSKDIVFLGNSITDGCEWAELFGDPNIKNRGISGDRTYFMLNRLDPIIKGTPKKLFLMIGINDLAANETPENTAGNIKKIVERFRNESPKTKIYVQSVLPVNPEFAKNAKRHGSKVKEVKILNEMIKAICAEQGATYLDVNSALSDQNGMLDAKYTNDGLHLLGAGYAAWKEYIQQYVK